MFSGELPKTDNSANHGDHLHQVFVNTKLSLELILEGYCLPDPYFKDHLQTTVEVLMKCLRDPALPLFELQVEFQFVYCTEQKQRNVIITGCSIVCVSVSLYVGHNYQPYKRVEPFEVLLDVDHVYIWGLDPPWKGVFLGGTYMSMPRLVNTKLSLYLIPEGELAAGQLQNKVQAVLPRPRHPLQSQPGVSDANSPVSRRQQITFRATLIFHLVDGLLSTTATHQVRRAGVLTCGSCHLERSEHRVLELIPVLGSQPADDMSHKPGGRLPLLSTRTAVNPATLKRAATNFAAW